jgi:N-acetylglucosamine-6-phosphate deacetylase
MREAGVATCLPALITADEATLLERLHALDMAVANGRLGRTMVPGFHLEGPFLNPAAGYAGCHPSAAMVPPDPVVLDRLVKGLKAPVLLVTLAPELTGALDVIAWARRNGIVTAMGHTAASLEATEAAVAAGLSLRTHLGNALPQPQPKFVNPLMAQLAQDGLSASFIADGIHIPPHVLRTLIRAKATARSILVTDATAAASAPPGLYRFAGMAIERGDDGAVRLPNSATLAGSALTLDQAVRNLVAWNIADTATAVAMASVQPLALIAPALAWHGIAWPPDK